MLVNFVQRFEMLVVLDKGLVLALSVHDKVLLSVIERAVNIFLALKTVRDTLYVCKQPLTINVSIGGCKTEGRSYFTLHAVAALPPNDGIYSFEALLELGLTGNKNLHLQIVNQHGVVVRISQIVVVWVRGPDRLRWPHEDGVCAFVCQAVKVSCKFDGFRYVLFEHLSGLAILLLAVALVETLENVSVHLRRVTFETVSLSVHVAGDIGVDGCASGSLAVARSPTVAVAVVLAGGDGSGPKARSRGYAGHLTRVATHVGCCGMHDELLFRCLS